MGDRALIQMVNGDEASPVLYLHWMGSEVGKIIEQAQTIMEGRAGDVSYAFARLVAAACNESGGGNTGVGVWNGEGVLKARDSHGDAGCFVIDVSSEKWAVRIGGGYGFDGAAPEALGEVTELD